MYELRVQHILPTQEKTRGNLGTTSSLTKSCPSGTIWVFILSLCKMDRSSLFFLLVYTLLHPVSLQRDLYRVNEVSNVCSEIYVE